MKRKNKVTQKANNRLFIGLVIGVIIILIPFSYANANIHITGSTGGGLLVGVVTNISSDFDQLLIDVNRIYPDIDETKHASAREDLGSYATSNGTLKYSTNANSLGWIVNDTVGEFSITMLGDASKAYGNRSLAYSYDDFGTYFYTDCYYEYTIEGGFANYYGYSDGKIYLKDDYTLFYSTRDLNNTTEGSATGILAPGSYLFGSYLNISFGSSAPSYSFGANRLDATLILTPTEAPVPAPGSGLLLMTGLGVLICWKRIKYSLS